MRIKTPRCAFFPPRFLLELFLSVSLFLFVLHLLTHVVLINFISPVISAFAIVEIYSVYTLAYFRLEKSRVPKIEKRENEKKNRGGNWGEEGRRHRLRPWMWQLLGREVTNGMFPWPQTIITQLKEWHVIVSCNQLGETLRAAPTLPRPFLFFLVKRSFLPVIPTIWEPGTGYYIPDWFNQSLVLSSALYCLIKTELARNTLANKALC